MTTHWLDQGLVMLTNHEPLTFIVRRGRQPVAAAQQFAYEHTEATSSSATSRASTGAATWPT